jgi:hypothetical protein
MHKIICASGFLYHLPSEQILLQQHPQSTSQTSPWMLFTKEHKESEDSEKVFKKYISELLKTRVGNVETVYTYMNDKTNTQCNIVYSEVTSKREFPSKKGVTYKWFTFKEVIKLPLADQVKHDLVVSKRVIDATARKSRGEFTSSS